MPIFSYFAAEQNKDTTLAASVASYTGLTLSSLEQVHDAPSEIPLKASKIFVPLTIRPYSDLTTSGAISSVGIQPSPFMNVGMANYENELAVREYQINAYLAGHPSIPDVGEIYVTDDRKVMYFVKGTDHLMSLKSYLDRSVDPSAGVACIAKQVLSAMDHMHSKGISHNDLLSSIGITSEGLIKIVRFSAASEILSTPHISIADMESFLELMNLLYPFGINNEEYVRFLDHINSTSFAGAAAIMQHPFLQNAVLPSMAQCPMIWSHDDQIMQIVGAFAYFIAMTFYEMTITFA